MPRNTVFVCGTHTDIGKTHVACAVIRAGRARGLAMDAVKPVVSGIDPDDLSTSDPGRLLAALGRPLAAAELERISPLRFAAALSPPMAARREGVVLRLEDLAAPCRAAMTASTADLLLIEGVGGLMSPVTDAETGLDLMLALGAPALLVSGAYLGAISHALTALAAGRAAGVKFLGLVVSESADVEAPDFAETVDDLRRLVDDLPVVAAPRAGGEAWADEVLALLS